MQYTGKGNIFLWYIFIPSLLIFYLLFRFLEWNLSIEDANKKEYLINYHYKNVENIENINGLVLGGSNSMFSISAEQLSKNYNNAWYNLSILAEGFSYKNYWKFVDRSINFNQKNNIKTIIYSSVAPLRNDGRIYSSPSVSYGIEGDTRFKLVGNTSVASYLKEFLTKGTWKYEEKNWPVPNMYGDFNFNLYECDNKSLGGSYEVEEDLQLLTKWVISQLENIRSIFPVAHIYFVLPSEYYLSGFSKTKNDILLETLNRSVKVYKESYNDLNVSLIIQKPFENIEFMCEGKHHTNNKGRLYRTTDLINKISLN
jgi:hypothetical protein